MAIKLKKTLYVGLGGTGVATLLKIKKCFIDSYGEIPPMIGFLAIDTDGGATSKSITSNLGYEIRLEPSELLVCTVKGALNVYSASPKIYDWVPSKNVDKLSYIQGAGAGQVRSNGRFIAYYNNKLIKNNIQSAITKILQLIPQGSRYVVDTNINGVEYPVNVNVIASVAGGTGSGMLVDVLAAVKDAIEQQGVDFKMYPWIVLPEIFRAMATGPAMANVLYNSYGALRSLDYIMHYNPKTPPIDLGHSKIKDALFEYAYIINNTNQAGVSFSNLDDLVDVIAKSAFLPANKMGDDLASPFDNIAVQKASGTYDILNKKAWVASVGSAELVYDSQAVGRARACRIITQLCDSMLQSDSDGLKEANDFFDDPNVMIRENEGRDDVIDYMLSPFADYPLEVDENTTVQMIEDYIEDNCNPGKLEGELKKRLDAKLSIANQYFDQYIERIMSYKQGKVDTGLKFIQAVLDIVGICKREMQSELDEFRSKNSIPKQWAQKVNSIQNKGIKAMFKPVDLTAATLVRDDLSQTVSDRREELRREWALRFYSAFERSVMEKQTEIETLKTYVKQIGKNYTKRLLEEQNMSDSTSKFQIFLHGADLMTTSSYKIDDTIKSSFVQYLGRGASEWIGLNEKNISNSLWDFAKDTAYVKDAVNANIDEILSRMPAEKVLSYINHLKVLASPLWTYNTQGFSHTHMQLDRFVIIGVGNRDTSVLCTNKDYKNAFETNGNKATFASTSQNDRVYLLIVEDLLPIYAINNFSSYERDTENKVMRGVMMANYLDEKLNNRMNVENFNILPTQETDDVLQYWVWGFVFDFIHYDNESEQYWIRSKERGDALDDYRFNLSKQRDVAFDIFKSERLYKEIENGLDSQIKKYGRTPIDEKINQIKAERCYLEQYAQLSPLEKSNIREPKFKAVSDLLRMEIGLMTE